MIELSYSSMDVKGDYEPVDADGFIKINALRLRENAKIEDWLSEREKL